MKRSVALCLGLLFCGALLIASYFDENESQAQQSRYCEMRKIYEESDGRYGWPNYDPKKEESCLK